MNQTQIQAALQSSLMVLGSLASSYGFLTASQASSVQSSLTIIVGAVFAIIGAVWNHNDAAPPTGSAPK